MSTHQVPPICIMRAFSTTTEDLVWQTFSHIFGESVDKVKLIPRKDRNSGEPFWLVFVYFREVMVDKYPDPAAAISYASRIEAGEEVRVEYAAPYFWKTVKCRTSERKTAPPPRIILSSDK
jgi:hypothetical protein